MFDILKKTYLAGADLAAKTWDEVEALSKDLVKKAKMSENEGSKFLKDMKKRYDDTQKKLEARVEKTVKEFLKKANVVTSDELKAVKKEIRELKKMELATGLVGTTQKHQSRKKKSHQAGRRRKKAL